MRQGKTGYSRLVLAIAAGLLVSNAGWSQSGAGETLPDAQIEANVLKSLAGTSQLAGENIQTNTVYGTVTLSGTVKDEPTRQLAENLASRANGVKKVVDELTLSSAGASGNGIPSGVPQQDSGAPGDGSQGGNPRLQSDGTMAPAQHAPDPDVYAQQHGIAADSAQNGQGTAPSDQGAVTQPQPGYRQPYSQNDQQQPYAQQQDPQQQQQYPQQQPYPQQQQPYAQQQPYPQNSQQGRYPGNQQGSYQAPPQGAQRSGPPPYGAQAAGVPVTVPQGALLRIRINEGLDSKHTQPGTPFDAVVLNDVVADGQVAIPRGASVQGTVIEAKDGGLIKGHGELALKLNQVTLSGRVFPLASDVWTAAGQDKGGQTVGSAVGLGAVGALIGAVAGGGAGAAIGAGAGAAAGVGASASTGRREVLIPAEAILTFHLAQPAPMTTISQAEMDRLSYGVPNGGGQQQQMRRRYPQPYYGPVYYPRPYPYPY